MAAAAALSGSKWEWMEDGKTVNGEVELCGDGKTLKAFGTSTWSILSDDDVVKVVCDNVGGSGKHVLAMNKTLSAFIISDGPGKGVTAGRRIITDLKAAAAALSGSKWEWMEDGKTVNGEVELCGDGKTLKAFGTSTWSILSDDDVVKVVCDNVGGSGKHVLAMNKTLSTFIISDGPGKGVTAGRRIITDV